MSGVIAQTSALIAVGVGLVALLGWAVGRPSLASIDVHWIPMPPSAALLFMVLGGAVILSARWPLRRAVHRAALGSAVSALIVGSALLFLSYQGIYLDAEHPGLALSGTVAGAPIGHMSPVTALWFMVSGASLVAVLVSSPTRNGAAIAGSWLAGAMVIASAVFQLAYLCGIPLFYWGSIIPPALTTCVAAAALGIALLALARTRGWDSALPPDSIPRTSRIYVVTMVILTLCLLGAAAIYSRQVVARNRAEAEQLLADVADLKVSELTNWRAERFGDAALLHENQNFSALVRRALELRGNGSARENLLDWLREVRDAYGYREVILFDRSGEARLSLTGAAISAPRIQEAHRALLSGEISLGDFGFDESSGAPYLSLLVPILGEVAGGTPVGVVMLGIDPSKYLYPMLKRWPTPSPTAETLLVRRDGSDVLFLNELRFQGQAPASRRVPLTRTDLPGVMAVLGSERIVEGTDYLGAPAIAALRKVPGTPWYLVARVATHELYQASFNALALIVGVIATLLFSVAMVLGQIWQQQRTAFIAEQSRTAELGILTQKLAHSNKELEQFAHVASHDLQEPLRMVVGFVQLLEQRLADKLNEETREFMGFAVDGALRMQRQIQDILAYSRVTTRGLPLHPVESAAALKEALDRLATRIHETGAEVSAPSLPMVMADRAQLVQLFQNLIGNAIKFCKGRAPRVAVNAVRRSGKWRFTVTDNGIGIEPEFRRGIFAIFNRLHTQREYPGTGIGLAICERIVERHGGEIGVEAAPEGGSVFWFTIPEGRTQ